MLGNSYRGNTCFNVYEDFINRWRFVSINIIDIWSYSIVVYCNKFVILFF